MAESYQEILVKTRKFGFLRPISRYPCMESSIQNLESIERVKVDLESVLVELESVHRRILPRNTKFSCFRAVFLYNLGFLGIRRNFGFWERYHRIVLVKIYLESRESGLESVHGRIVPRNT